MTSSLSSPGLDLEQLRQRLRSKSDRPRRQAITQLLGLGEPGIEVLKDYLQDCRDRGFDWVAGTIFRELMALQDEAVTLYLAENYPFGLLYLPSEKGIDYQPIQDALIEGDWQEADRLTTVKLCELAGTAAKARKWLYYTEVLNFPRLDLETIDKLWRVYSEDKFGFSVQRELWLSVDRVWEQLWPRINWKQGNTWTRYPGAFTWSLEAPRGHLPLTNQLRGVRVMAALLEHPAFAEPQK